MEQCPQTLIASSAGICTADPAPNPKRAFTLVELLVVVTIIVILLAILTPAIDKAMEQAQRAVCGSNLKSIQNATVAYASDHRSALYIAWGRAQQNFIAPRGVSVAGSSLSGDENTDWAAGIAPYGLTSTSSEDANANGVVEHQPSRVWDCPSRPHPKSRWYFDMTDDAMHISYAYYGGIYRWANTFWAGRSRSPIRLSKSGGGWVVATDLLMKIDNKWAHSTAQHESFHNSQSHRDAGGLPLGANQTYVDGSVEWVDFDRMIFVHSWFPSNRQTFMWQQDLGAYDPPIGAYGPAWR